MPRTFVLPSHSWGEGVTSESLTNLALPIDWQRIADELGFPMYLRPHCGGGWRDVHRVGSLEELFTAYDRSGCETMLLQEETAWTQYVRCIVVGKEEVLPALWDPRRWHYERYVCADESMPPLSREQVDELSGLSRKLCGALGYDMNTIEWAIRGGVPYAVDFMNSTPDFDLSSLGESCFRWVITKMADLVIALAKNPGRRDELRWDRMI